MEEKIIISMIRNYLNVSKAKYPDERIKEEYPEAIAIASKNYNELISEKRIPGIVSITQGSQSVTYSATEADEIVIDGLVKALLPRPFIRMF